jgi:hypothetical protein
MIMFNIESIVRKFHFFFYNEDPKDMLKLERLGFNLIIFVPTGRCNPAIMFFWFIGLCYIYCLFLCLTKSNLVESMFIHALALSNFVLSDN